MVIIFEATLFVPFYILSLLNGMLDVIAGTYYIFLKYINDTLIRGYVFQKQSGMISSFSQILGCKHQSIIWGIMVASVEASTFSMYLLK